MIAEFSPEIKAKKGILKRHNHKNEKTEKMRTIRDKGMHQSRWSSCDQTEEKKMNGIKNLSWIYNYTFVKFENTYWKPVFKK